MSNAIIRTFRILVFFSSIQNPSFGQIQYEIEIIDSIKVDYIGTLEFLHFDEKSARITAYDRNRDQFLEIDRFGEINMVKQMFKEGPDSYGTGIQGISFLNEGGIFIEGNKYFVSLNNDWTQKTKKRKTEVSFNPLSLFKMSVYPSFQDFNGQYSVLSPADLMSYSSATRDSLRLSKLLNLLHVENFNLSGIVNYDLLFPSEEEFLPDFKKPILKLINKNQLFLTFTYSKKIFKISLEPEVALIDGVELKGGLFESNRVGISFDLPSVKRRDRLRGLVTQNDKLLDFWVLDNFLIVKMQKGIPKEKLSKMNSGSISSVEKYMDDLQKWSNPKYHLYSNNVLLSESLDIDGDILFSDRDIIYVQKKSSESVENSFFKIIKYQLSLKL